MSVLDQLRKTLRNLNQVALARMRPGDSLQMLNEQSKLKEWISGTSQFEKATSNTIEEALRAYQKNNYLKGLRQVRLVCYGCTQPFGSNSYSLIESREHFEKLLEHVGRYGYHRRTFRKLYRSLLGCYFSYDPYLPDTSLSGRSNWETLRKFLRNHLDSLPPGRFTPEWLSVLTQHPNLLGDDPCKPYAFSISQGDWSAFNDVRERLEIGAVSWLVRQMVMNQITAVEHMDDSTFKEHLESVLLLLNDYTLYAGTGLKALLERYVRCENREVNASLRDMAVWLWGNPWLPDSAHQWQCSAEARKMLEHWLQRHLLSEFFSLLSNDDSVHSRRLNFWGLYSEDLTGMYFALGEDTFAIENTSLYKFRRIARGLVARLSEKKHNVHACIMQFEHYHVVEFNRDNNMAYFYDIRQGIPLFYLSKGWIEIGALSVANIAQGIDIKRPSKPLRHQDTKQLTWEGKFAQELGATENAIQAFCRRYQCLYDDRRNQGGYQWIRPSHSDQYGREVWSVLLGWGFCFSIEESGYFRLPNHGNPTR